MNSEVHRKAALDLLTSLSDGSVDMIYTDPPFGTEDVQTLTRKSHGEIVSKISYIDKHEDYLEFLLSHLVHLHRVLKDTGTLYLHLDWRWVHYAKVMCDGVFGKDNFLNEVVWSYNVGGRGKDRWPRKHDTILVYTKSIGKHVFNWDDVDRIPYKTPEVQYIGRSKEEAEKRIAAGQVPTDVWEMTLSNMSSERVGYPNQKPVKLVRRCVVASSPPGGLVLDPFAGSGTTGDAALSCGRKFVMSDASQDAVQVMRHRFIDRNDVVFIE